LHNDQIALERDVKRFWKNVLKGPDCWLWIGTKQKSASNVYGIFWSSIKKGNLKAHVFSFQLHANRIKKEGTHIHHKCNNTTCVNPDHLEEVTPVDHPGTTGDLNRRKTHCPKGHEYIEENTRRYITLNGYTLRVCRACDRER
jgi:hypothetical protein